MVVEVDWRGVLSEQGEPHIVGRRHCAPKGMLVNIAYREILEVSSRPARHDRHFLSPFYVTRLR
jgi:hypothetical protein